jgi:hypothetical protein
MEPHVRMSKFAADLKESCRSNVNISYIAGNLQPRGKICIFSTHKKKRYA